MLNSRVYLLLLLIIASGGSTAAAAGGGGGWRWQRKPWMNHGSFRGPRDRLVNPTVEHPFQLPKLPI
ncbi:photolyase 1 [Perilla frutescens var. hirtella]|uniref:Photolyase 1 n=1 Tax=Perilla frutescens var. hirtella TaxID=608512 RepID=A0AAD4IZT8_PERFH|nr:photolyase 1 [Perilla frutescens var. hirtella]